MEDDGKIKIDDLIGGDTGVIKELVTQLTKLNDTFGTFSETVKANAKEMANALKMASSATAEGRAQIEKTIDGASRLKRAQEELTFSMSEVGKTVAWVKAQTVDQNRMTVEMKRQSESLIGSYDKLSSELKEQIQLWKSLSATERGEAFGVDLQKSISETKARLMSLDDQLKVHVTKMSEVQKAEKELAFWSSEEGKRLAELKQKIHDVKEGYKEEKQVIDEVTKAKQAYAYAASETNEKVQELKQATQEANKIAKLQARLNMSAVGSYNQLAAQYELNKIKLNAMSDEERHSTEAGKQLEAQTLKLYEQMIKLQEATGNHKLSVGNYKLAWSGLGNAMNQVLREIPNATMGMNMFFLSISNNIPILIDEINKLREQNKALAAEGKATTSVIKTIVKTIFSWQTALLLCITALAMHGKEIWEWTKKMANGGRVIKDMNELFEDMAKEVTKSGSTFGKQVATLRELSREWRDLTSDKSRLQFIKDHKKEFDELNVSIHNVADAENLLINNTDRFIEALALRAKQTAAMKLAADYYEKALQKQMEAEQEEYIISKEVDEKTGKTVIKKTKKTAKDASVWDKLKAGMLWLGGGDYVPAGSLMYGTMDNTVEAVQKDAADMLKNEAESYDVIATDFIDMMQNFGEQYDALLKELGIDKKHKSDKSGREPRDLMDVIMRNDIAIYRKYLDSLAQLQRNEFEKRRQEAVNQAEMTIREMDEKYRKNEEYLTNPEGKYKPLTPEQKAAIEKQQKEIQAIKDNAIRKRDINLTAIQNERELDKNQKLRSTMPFSMADMEKALEDEKVLILKQLDDLQNAYATIGSTIDGKVDVTLGMTPEEVAAFERERYDIINKYNKLILDMQLRDIDSRLAAAQKGSQEELDLLDEQLDKALQLALVQNRLKPVEEREDEGALMARYDKNAKIKKGGVAMNRFDDAQARVEAEFNIVKRNDYQITLFRLNAERDRWKKMVELAKDGMLDWSEEQIKEAEAKIGEFNRKIKEAGDFTKLVGDKGIGGALLTKLGYDDDDIQRIQNGTDIIIESIQSITQAEVEAAEAMVEAANKRVEAAQAAYDAEIEGRNNGYANNVATAKKELQLEKKNQQQKQKLLEEAKRRQEAVNTAVQTSSLITASAELWSSFSGLGPVGPALALAAIAAMWGSFAVSKVKAAQVTKMAQDEYGEGGLEILEGGSHASGNDIDLHTTNSKGHNMRAEGGEAMAIINRRNTRKYRKVLPQIVDSLNKGTFEEKFSRAFETGDNLSQNVVYQQQMVDLSRLEEDVRQIKRNGEVQYYSLPNGTIIEKRRNVTHIIH